MALKKRYLHHKGHPNLKLQNLTFMGFYSWRHASQLCLTSDLHTQHSGLQKHGPTLLLAYPIKHACFPQKQNSIIHLCSFHSWNIVRWKIKIPRNTMSRIITNNPWLSFSWRRIQRRILTKDSLTHRGWKGAVCYQFCSMYESIDHLFFCCTLARYVLGVARCAFGMATTPSGVTGLFGCWLPSYADGTTVEN